MATSRTKRVPTTPARGQQLPDFTATDADGRTARPRDYYMRRNLVLVFTHGPECPYCQAFLRRLARQQRGVEAEAGQAMIVVPAEVEAIRTLRDQLDLPYPVVADPDGVSNLYRMAIDGGPVERLSSVSTGIAGITAVSPSLSAAATSGYWTLTAHARPSASSAACTCPSDADASA